MLFLYTAPKQLTEYINGFKSQQNSAKIQRKLTLSQISSTESDNLKTTRIICFVFYLPVLPRVFEHDMRCDTDLELDFKLRMRIKTESGWQKL